MGFIFGDSYNIDFEVIFLSIRNGPSVTHNLNSERHCWENMLLKRLIKIYGQTFAISQVCKGKMFLTSEKKVLIEFKVDIESSYFYFLSRSVRNASFFFHKKSSLLLLGYKFIVLRQFLIVYCLKTYS